MPTFARRFVAPALSVALLGLSSLLPGCDWLTGTGEGERKSPYIRNLVISVPRVRCDKTFTIVFSYDDLQGDIAQAIVSQQLEGSETSVQESFPFPEGLSPTRDTWSIDSLLGCDDTKGSYKITVWVEDDGGHKSNELVGSIILY